MLNFVNTKSILATFAAASLTIGAVTATASPAQETVGAKSYQVTGIVKEITPTMMVIRAHGERWEINRALHKAPRHRIHRGDRVTVSYTMTATSVERRSEKASSLHKAKEATKNSAESAADAASDAAHTVIHKTKSVTHHAAEKIENVTK